MANVVVILTLRHWETIPFHFIWVSLTIVYGLRVWSTLRTAEVLAAVMLVTGIALWSSLHATGHGLDELSEVPLMAAMFVAMVWHAQRRQVAVQQARLAAQAEHRQVERQRQFVHDASHELRTPITVATGHAELIRRDHLDDQTGRDAEVVLDELARLARMSERLLVLASAQHEDFLRLRDLEVARFMEDVFDRWSRTEERRWTLHLQAPGVLLVDEERLRLAVDALVENAVQFTDAGGMISLGVRAEHGAALFEVVDSGPGVPADQRDRIFERFARVDEGRARQGGGTGLGLAIVKAIVEAHGGAAWVDGAAGAIFRIRIPGYQAVGSPTLESMMAAAPPRSLRRVTVPGPGGGANGASARPAG